MSDPRVSSADYFSVAARGLSVLVSCQCLPLTVWEVPHSSRLSPAYAIRRPARTAALDRVGFHFLAILISVPSAMIVGVKVFFSLGMCGNLCFDWYLAKLGVLAIYFNIYPSTFLEASCH